MRLSPVLRKILKGIQDEVGQIRAALVASRPDTKELISAIRDSKETDHLDREHERDILVSLRAKEQVRKTSERYARRYQKKNYRVQKGLAVGTWLAFIAAAIYAAIAAGTYREIQRQTTEAQKTANAAAQSAALASWALVESEESSYFLLQEMGAQTKAQIDSARAAKNAIEFAEKDRRPWVGLSAFRIEHDPKGLNLAVATVVNSGRNPARKVRGVIGEYITPFSHALSVEDERWLARLVERTMRGDFGKFETICVGYSQLAKQQAADRCFYDDSMGNPGAISTLYNRQDIDIPKAVSLGSLAPQIPFRFEKLGNFIVTGARRLCTGV